MMFLSILRLGVLGNMDETIGIELVIIRLKSELREISRLRVSVAASR